MIDKDRKLLTEFLGECWHEYDKIKVPKREHYMYCDHCGIARAYSEEERTFDTWQDLGDLKEKLVEKDIWDEFYYWGIDQVMTGSTLGNATTCKELILPTTFCQLVADFLRKQS